MLKFNTLVKNEYAIAYDCAYDFPLKKQFSEPKIHIAKSNLEKRWYVYFSYRDPSTNKLKRQTPFYGNANTYKTKEERLAVLTIYKRIIHKYLKQGFSPYENNTGNFIKIHQASSPKTVNEIVEKPVEIITIVKSPSDLAEVSTMGVSEAFDFVLKIKKKTLRDSSIRSYTNHIKLFQEWLNITYSSIKVISDINKQIINQFLNYILSKDSARYRNNFRGSLSSLFQVLEDNDVITTNFVSKINKLKSEPKKNKAYSKEMCDDIFKYLEQKDSYLLLYLKFVSYMFLRPLEVCRLKIGDINLKDKTISFKAKNSPLKTKIIPEVLFNELPDISKFDKSLYLFTSEGFGRHSTTKLENRRGYFTKRFNKVVKKEFSLDLDHTLYSFRHTFITKLYREFVKGMAPFEAKSKLMQITGHSSMKALENYLRDIDAELPDDYSDLLVK